MIQVGILKTIQVGTPKKYGTPGATALMERPWKSSFFRTPSDQPRWLYTTHLEGNEQAHKGDHGSLDQAILMYAAAHYPLWQQELERPEMGPGGFAENFTVEGLTEETVAIGDIYAIGEAQIQVTGPRYPCMNISRRWHQQDLMDRASKTGRTGWYCGVVHEGRVEPGLPIMLVERPYPECTVGKINAFAHGRNKDIEQAKVLALCPLLNIWWRKLIMRIVESEK